MIRKGIYRFAMLMIFQIMVLTIFPQSPVILFVEANPSPGSEDVGGNINKALKEELKKQMPEYWSIEKSFSEWHFVKNKAAYLKDNSITHLLQIRDLPNIRSIDNKVEIGFDFYYVDSTFKLETEIWDNSTYILRLKNKVPRNAALIATTVKDEIQYYLGSNADITKRKFRPRVKISDFVMPTEGIEDIDTYDFKEWLSQQLESKTESNPVCIFYDPEWNELYPDDAEHTIGGKFIKYKVSTDNLVRIQIILKIPGEPKRFASVINLSNRYKPVDNVDIVKEIVNALEEKYNQ